MAHFSSMKPVSIAILVVLFDLANSGGNMPDIFGHNLPETDTFISDFNIQQPFNRGRSPNAETQIAQRRSDDFPGFPRSPFNSRDTPRRDRGEMARFDSAFGSGGGNWNRNSQQNYQSLRQGNHGARRRPYSENKSRGRGIKGQVKGPQVIQGQDDKDLYTPDNYTAPLTSKYIITLDGHTPFGQANNSQIIYDDNGEPEEVVVFINPDGTPSESREVAGAFAEYGTGSKGLYEPKTYDHDSKGYDDVHSLKDFGKDDTKGYALSPHKGHEGKSYHDDHHSGYGHDDHHDDHHSGYGHDDHHSHSSYGHDDHGHSSHGSHSGYGHGHGHGHHDYHVVPVKKPGPFGYGKPNFKCEYAKETLYVTKTDYKSYKKCFKVFKTDCKHVYDTGKGIGYKKECSEFSVTKCRTIYITNFKTKCFTVYKKVCNQIYKTKIDWKYKEKCTTSYSKECSGYGYHKHCHEVPHEKCKQVPVKVEKKIPKTVCTKKPDKKCKDVPFFIPKKECKDFPKTVCVQDPINVKKPISKKKCFPVPIEKCIKIPKEVLKHIPKTVKKKVCVSTKVHYDHHVDHGHHHDDHHSHGYHDSSHDHYRTAKLPSDVKLPSPVIDDIGKESKKTDVALAAHEVLPSPLLAGGMLHESAAQSTQLDSSKKRKNNENRQKIPYQSPSLQSEAPKTSFSSFSGGGFEFPDFTKFQKK